MKVHIKILGLVTVLSLLGLSACGGGAIATATVDAAPIYTQIASTALALQTQTVLAKPTATSTPQVSPPPQASPTLEGANPPLFTDTPQTAAPSAEPSAAPSATARPLNTPRPTSQASCDNMQGVEDVTIQDGYVAAPGEVMDKTWRIKNLGPCIWDQDYSLAYAYGGEGTNWADVQPTYLSNEVQPGDTVDITITLKAPTAKGTYGAYFKMRNDKGFFFGSVVWITIQVE